MDISHNTMIRRIGEKFWLLDNHSAKHYRAIAYYSYPHPVLQTLIQQNFKSECSSIKYCTIPKQLLYCGLWPSCFMAENHQTFKHPPGQKHHPVGNKQQAIQQQIIKTNDMDYFFIFDCDKQGHVEIRYCSTGGGWLLYQTINKSTLLKIQEYHHELYTWLGRSYLSGGWPWLTMIYNYTQIIRTTTGWVIS